LGRDGALSEATKYTFVRSCELYVNKILNQSENTPIYNHFD
jgi:hypothetical protein